MRVLITCGGGFQGLTLIKELRRLDGICIHIANSQFECLGRYFSDFCSIFPPVSSEREYVVALQQYVSDQSIELVIPATPHDLSILATLRESFESMYGVRIAVSDSLLLKTLLDKKECGEWLRVKNHPTFEEFEIDQLIENIPLFGRKRTGWGGQGSIVVRDATQLNDLPGVHEYIWTSYIDIFSECSIDFSIDFSGRVSSITARERVFNVGGFSVVSKEKSLPRNQQQQVQLLTQDLAKAGGCGLFNVQIIQDMNGKWYFSDINPRVGTSAVMAQHCGNNLCAHLLEVPIPVRETSEPITIVRGLEEKIIETAKLDEIKCIVFDLDDTLLPHKPWILEKVRHVASKFIPDQKDDFVAVAKQLIEEGRAFCLYDDLCKIFKLDQLKVQMIDSHRSYCHENIETYPGAVDLLKSLKSRYQLALLSDNPANSQRQKLDVFQGTDLFDLIVLTDELGFSKPDPRTFEAVLNELSVDGHSAVMVGDNFHRDIAGAINAGFRHAFFMSHPDRLFNTSASETRLGDVTSLNNINELRWYLL